MVFVLCVVGCMCTCVHVVEGLYTLTPKCSVYFDTNIYCYLVEGMPYQPRGTSDNRNNLIQ